MNDSRRTLRCAAMASPSRWLALALVACAAATPAHAASLPAPSSSVFCSVEGNSFRHATECEFGGVPPIPSSAVAEVVPSIPFVIATASTPATGLLGAGASATVLYWFQVAGPTVGQRVPILMDTSLVTQATGESSALARLIVNTTSGTFQGFEACTDDDCDRTSFTETISLSVLSGSVNDTVTLYAEAQARRNEFANESASATADPYIRIDPSFPDAHLYSVVVSAGIGNAPPPPVPEPGTVWLLGVGLLGLAVRKCRQ